MFRQRFEITGAFVGTMSAVCLDVFPGSEPQCDWAQASCQAAYSAFDRSGCELSYQHLSSLDTGDNRALRIDITLPGKGYPLSAGQSVLCVANVWGRYDSGFAGPPLTEMRPRYVCDVDSVVAACDQASYQIMFYNSDRKHFESDVEFPTRNAIATVEALGPARFAVSVKSQ